MVEVSIQKMGKTEHCTTVTLQAPSKTLKNHTWPIAQGHLEAAEEAQADSAGLGASPPPKNNLYAREGAADYGSPGCKSSRRRPIRNLRGEEHSGMQHGRTPTARHSETKTAAKNESVLRLPTFSLSSFFSFSFLSSFLGSFHWPRSQQPQVFQPRHGQLNPP